MLLQQLLQLLLLLLLLLSSLLDTAMRWGDYQLFFKSLAGIAA